ncbi:CDP-alcohol phosphatidyltransferase family protein [Clostridium sp. MB40-C1]|uniref:CDP-alcohol phosphatidyltransferase family protein n=1 Tax=Clostridium sp. MB40-C1 TaxID=3070996 RepID=UPI0027E09297|nr:CDP-alcohol phosphatidyltransferase family protein [Clostridium sp. MB40-C1]WMJ81497.1 CDP-alcohol phosphatidyltransferase family protein [Clostridium sp. MB40-C1]
MDSSDIIDGFIARKIGKTSSFGAKIDSVADMIMVGVLLFLLYPIIKPTTKIVIWVIFKSSKKIVRIVSPFIGFETAKQLSNYVIKRVFRALCCLEKYKEKWS